MTSTLSISDMVTTIEQILSSAHKEREKQKVKVFPNLSSAEKLQIACPVCGDSKSNTNKKRGNLYLKNFRYVCYNCDENMTYIAFLELFGYQVTPDQKMQIVETLEHFQKGVRYDEAEFIANGLDKVMEMSELENYCNTHPASRLTQFRPIRKDGKVWQYLTNRGITEHTNIYEAEYKHTDKWREPVLVNLNAAGGKVVGMQLRNLKSDKFKRFFKVYTFTEMYTMVTGKELDVIEAHAYNKISQLYNILTIDWSQPITVFEGFLDTKFFPNAIGCVGTNTDTGILHTQDTPIRYFYDADTTGQFKAEKAMKAGYRVFLWEKLFENWVKNAANPYAAYRKVKEKIKDLGDLANAVRKPYSTMQLENYFSVDTMDIVWMKKITA